MTSSGVSVGGLEETLARMPVALILCNAVPHLHRHIVYLDQLQDRFLIVRPSLCLTLSQHALNGL